MMLEGNSTRLRAVEPDDVGRLCEWENDSRIWLVSGTVEPFSRAQMERFVAAQCESDLIRRGDLRLMIETRPEPCEVSGDGLRATAACRDDASAAPDGRPERIDRTGRIFRTVGAVDLFDYDPLNQRAGVGILIHRADDRGRGYASDALSTLCRYARECLRLHQLWCEIDTENIPSLRLFHGAGFSECGVKRDWQWSPEGYRDIRILQKLFV